jgi:hypothetical protein
MQVDVKSFQKAIITLAGYNFEQRLERALNSGKVGAVVDLIEKNPNRNIEDQVKELLEKKIFNRQSSTFGGRILEALSGHSFLPAMIADAVRTAAQSFTEENIAFIMRLAEAADVQGWKTRAPKLYEAIHSTYKEVTGLNCLPVATGRRASWDHKFGYNIA